MRHFSARINYHRHCLRVVGDVYPAEKDSWSEWNGGTPGHPAYLDDLRIFVVYKKREREVQDPDGKLAEAIEDDVFEALCDDDD